jgi:hypothetical protein
VSASSSLARAAAVAALVAAAAPAAAAAQPTLGVDRPCYSTGDVIAVSGAGYTPGGTVSLTFAGAGMRHSELRADLAGDLRASFEVGEQDVEGLLARDESQREVLLAAVEQPPTADPAVPPAGATTFFVLSRFGFWWDQDDDAFRPRRRLAIDVVGFAGHARRTLYLHYLRDGRRVATVSLGRLRGPCGTLRRTLARAFPMDRVRAGTWRLAFTLSRTNPRALPRLEWDVRVRRRDAVG